MSEHIFFWLAILFVVVDVVVVVVIVVVVVVAVVVVVVVIALTRIFKSVVTGQAPVTLELSNTRGKTQTNQRWYTHISQLTQFMLHQKHIKAKSGVSLRCAGPYWCTRLTIRAWQNRLFRLPPKKDYHVYIARSTCHCAYARQAQVNWKKETKKIKEDKEKEREYKKAKKRKRKGKKRKEKKRRARKDKK